MVFLGFSGKEKLISRQESPWHAMSGCICTCCTRYTVLLQSFLYYMLAMLTTLHLSLCFTDRSLTSRTIEWSRTIAHSMLLLCLSTLAKTFQASLQLQKEHLLFKSMWSCTLSSMWSFTLSSTQLWWEPCPVCAVCLSPWASDVWVARKYAEGHCDHWWSDGFVGIHFRLLSSAG